ncbi:hypothetical protein Droror1_Dr00008532 [Drosera rotundifolia]
MGLRAASWSVDGDDGARRREAEAGPEKRRRRKKEKEKEKEGFGRNLFVSRWGEIGEGEESREEAAIGERWRRRHESRRGEEESDGRWRASAREVRLKKMGLDEDGGREQRHGA